MKEEIGYNDVDRIIAEQIEEAKKNGGEYQGRESEPKKREKPSAEPSAKAGAPGPGSAKDEQAGTIQDLKAATVEK